MHAHNSLAMFMRNRTQQFIEDFCNEDDDVWAMRAARKYDASGVEKARRAEQAEFELRMVEMKKERQAVRVAKKNAMFAELAGVRIILSGSEINNLTGKKMDEQYRKLRTIWGSRLPATKGFTGLKVAERKLALKAVIQQHLALKAKGEVEMELVPVSAVSEVIELTATAWEEDEDEVLGD